MSEASQEQNIIYDPELSFEIQFVVLSKFSSFKLTHLRGLRGLIDIRVLDVRGLDVRGWTLGVWTFGVEPRTSVFRRSGFGVHIKT